jgi:mRNA-degrading endonuclease toxin of MazEF toxin-antitoxin module
MSVNVGEVYWLTVYYPTTGEFETRPVVIIDIVNGVARIATFVALTTSEIKDFENKYDRWKVPLFKGKETGLGVGSYAKANCVADVDVTAFKKEDFKGTVHPVDLRNIIKKVNEFIESGEDPW